MIKWTWKCNHCNDQKESFSDQRWTKDTCKCKKSFVDLEPDYARTHGSITIINIEN